MYPGVHAETFCKEYRAISREERQKIRMLYNDPLQQGNQAPPYLPYRPVPGAQGGQFGPMTDKVEIVPPPYRLPNSSWQQPGVWYQPSTPPPPRRPSGRGGAIFLLTLLLAVVLGVGLFAGWTFARSSSAVSGSPTSPSSQASSNVAPSGSTLNSIEAAQEAAIAKIEPSIVEIEGQTFQAQQIGTGEIIDKNGDIITNDHVINGVNSLQVVLSDGNTVNAQVVGTDPANDLAIIRIQPFSGMVVATFGDSSQLVVGQEVLAVGSPLGYAETATEGVVSALNRTADESSSSGGSGAHLTGLIQTSAPINPGNSGGALINLQGQVVGITTLSALDNETNTPAEDIGFAIPSNQVQAAIKQMLG